MAEKGILTLEQEKKVASLVDDVIRLRGLLELIDGFVFKGLITFLDDAVLEKLNIDLKTKLSELVNAVMAEDLELAKTLATDLINSLIDLPVLDETAEGLLIKGVLDIIVAAILEWIGTEEGEPVTLTLSR
jgi:hypothetical protein